MSPSFCYTLTNTKLEPFFYNKVIAHFCIFLLDRRSPRAARVYPHYNLHGRRRERAPHGAGWGRARPAHPGQVRFRRIGVRDTAPRRSSARHTAHTAGRFAQHGRYAHRRKLRSIGASLAPLVPSWRGSSSEASSKLVRNRARLHFVRVCQSRAIMLFYVTVKEFLGVP